MKARSTRMLLLVLLVLALPPGATVAACLQSGPDTCCCANACPKPIEARVETGSCCEMTDGAALPTSVPATVVSMASKSFDDAGDRIDPFVASGTCAEGTVEVPPVRGTPSPVPLFTLHASLLI